MEIFIALLLILFCCLIIWKASDSFEAASEYLGRNLKEGVRGATINAIGSSVPELLTTFFFLVLLKDQEGFSGGIGTTAGSAIFNAIVIPAAVILAVIFAGKVSAINVSRKVILRDGISLLLCELVLILLLSQGVLTWWHGLVLMLLYVGYILYMFGTMKGSPDFDNPEEEEEDEEESENSTLKNILTLNVFDLVVGKGENNTQKSWTVLLIAVSIIAVASALLVHSCERLGSALEIPVYFVAVILASAATSVPDTFLSIKDAQKGNYDDAVSNALGSNIFDICFALGLPLFIYTLVEGEIVMSGEILENITELRILLFILTLLTFFIFIARKKLTTTQAYILLFLYVLFVAYVFAKSLESEFIKPISNLLHAINSILVF